MAEFKVGDIITGTSSSRYTYTTDKAIMKIINIVEPFSQRELHVEMLKHSTHPEDVGSMYHVDPKYFRLVKEGEYMRTIKDLKIGDIVIDEYKNEREVVAISDGYIATIDKYDGTDDVFGYKRSQLKDWTIKTDITELTLREVADKLGIDVKKLRIKE